MNVKVGVLWLGLGWVFWFGCGCYFVLLLVFVDFEFCVNCVIIGGFGVGVFWCFFISCFFGVFVYDFV